MSKEDDEISEGAIICNRALYATLSFVPVAENKQQTIETDMFSLGDALQLLDWRNADLKDDRASDECNSDENSGESSRNLYDLVVLTDIRLDCNAVATWLPEKALVIMLLKRVTERDTSTCEPPFYIMECGDRLGIETNMSILLGAACLASSHIALLFANCEIAKFCAKLVDDASSTCSVTQYDSTDRFEEHVRFLFDDENNEKDDENNSETTNNSQEEIGFDENGDQNEEFI
jgi:hypothetical protein